MCFSATASFVAGTALSAAGVVTVKKATRRREVPFALIPVFFGAQQLTEGFVWVSFHYGMPMLNSITTAIFALFAYVFWPAYVPFVVRTMETVPWRKRVLLGFQIIGIGVGAYLLYFNIRTPVTSEVVQNSIVYTTTYPHAMWIVAGYVLSTCVSAFFSRSRTVNLYGVLLFILGLIAYYFYTATYQSVWCYFAAILSVIVYWYIKNSGMKPAHGSDVHLAQ